MGDFDGQTNRGQISFFATTFDNKGVKGWTRIWGPTNEASAGGVVFWDSRDGDADNSIFAAGITHGGFFGEAYLGGDGNYTLTRWNDQGEHQWTRIRGSTNMNRGQTIALQDKGYVLVGGGSAGDYHGQTNVARQYGASLTAWTPDGLHLWTRLFGATNRSMVHGVAADPARTKTISAFWMDSTEVTKAHWDTVRNWANTNGYEIVNEGWMYGRSNTCPVQSVNWYNAVKWANARSKRLGLTPCYYTDASLTTVYRTGDVDVANNGVDWDADGFRLPTEVEWEKAARGGHEGRLFPWGGDTISHSQANYYSTNLFLPYDISPTSGFHPDFEGEAFPCLHPAGHLEMNAHGLYDMAGNVSEWCWDWYDESYYDVSPDTDPRGPDTGTWRCRRGGSWFEDANWCRTARRNFFFGGPGNGSDVLGFRCVRRGD